MAPELELRVLRLEDGGPRLRVDVVREGRAIGKLGLVPEGLDFLDLVPFGPGKRQRRLVSAVVLDVALPADERAHLVATGVDVRVVGRASISFSPGLDRRKRDRVSLALGQRRDASQKPRARDAQSHRLGIVAVHAAHRMPVAAIVKLLVHFRVRELVRGVEAFHGVAAPELAVKGHDRRVAVEARARLGFRQALGGLLVEEHERVAAPVAVVDGERVPPKHPLQPLVALDFLLGQGLAPRAAAEARLRGA